MSLNLMMNLCLLLIVVIMIGKSTLVFHIENLFGTNSENDDVNNCYTISTIHVSSNDDIESSKLGEEVFENPFATDDYIFETSPSSKNC